jgi:hypothetical protein
MKEKKQFDQNEIKIISERISRTTFEIFNSEASKEIKKILDKHQVLKYDIVHLMSSAIFDVYLNVLLKIKNFIESEKLEKISFEALLEVYINALKEILVKNKKTH